MHALGQVADENHVGLRGRKVAAGGVQRVERNYAQGADRIVQREYS